MPLKLYFLATDSVIGPNNQDLWVTDGTTAAPVGGLGDLSVSGSATGGLGPQNITAFGQQMIFAGADALNTGSSNGLWLTDGTAGKTTEIGGVSPGPGKSPPFTTGSVEGLTPNGFVTFASGTKAIFFGTDAQNFDGMWVTDGTVGGTVELGGLENLGINGKGPNFSPENLAAFNNDVLFDAVDSTGFNGLWITDGTTNGTVELGGVTKNQGVFDSGISNFVANDFITLGGMELFNAPNAEGDDALWITDGTGNGTVEIGGMNNAGIAGADNTNLGDGLANAVRFGNRIFFSGSDNTGAAGLWTTGGTANGTAEVGGLADAGVTGHPNPLGLNPTDLTVNGQQVLFNGQDAISFHELWASDGTANGTYEIGGQGVGGPLLNEASNGVNPTSIVSLGNGEAVFIGDDDSNGQPSGRPTLWVTNGTFAGTTEIGGLDNLGVSGIDPNGGFTFTSSLMGGDGLAYFIGADAAGTQVLWETDGTVGGTKIITSPQAPSTGINPTNLALAAPPVALTNFTTGGQTINLENIPGEEVNLSGTNNVPDTVNGSNGQINLSGAQAAAIGGGLLIQFVGTGVGNAVTLSNTNGNKDTVYGAKGVVTLNDAQVNVFGPQVISFAAGTSGNVVYLNGTTISTATNIENLAPGDTIDLPNIVANAASYSGSLLTLKNGSTTVAQFDVTTIHPAGNDFRVAPDGHGGTQVGLVPPIADFNADGMGDLLFQNTNGTPAIWEMNSTNPISQVALFDPSSFWHLVGTGDVNGDGKSDLVWQANDGTPAIWEMNGTTPTNEVALFNPGPSWHLIGTGDVNGDGMSDLVWQNNDGTPAIWEMNGTTPTNEVALSNPSSFWHLVGTGDVNGDGMSDLLWQAVDGTPAIWEMNGTTPTNEVALFNPGPSWHLIGSGDFNGDGMSDLLWQNNDGTPAIWLMNGTTPTSQVALPNFGPSWHVIGAEDLNGDGKSDIVFRNDSGQPGVWLMNGTTPTSMVGLFNPGTSWHILPGL